MTAISFLSHQKAATQTQLQSFEALIADLGPQELAWQPAPDKWSIIQCIEHLNISLAHYVPLMDAGIAEGHYAGQSPKEAFNSGFWGKRMPKMFAPTGEGKIGWKMKTFKRFQPEVPRELQAKTMADFRQHMQNLQTTCEAARAVDLGKVRILSAIGSMLRFKLGDCFKFVLAHNARHLLQAQRVREALPSPQYV